MRVVGEAVSHRGGAQTERVEAVKAARSVGGSHSVRKTNVHHDRCRPEVAVAQRRCPFGSVSGSPAPLLVAISPVVFLVATLRWPPVRGAAGLVFLWGAEAREGPPSADRRSCLRHKG